MDFNIKKILLFIAFAGSFGNLLICQTPFTSEKRTFLIVEDAGINQLVELIINPQNNAISIAPINTNLNMPVNGIGYRSTDNLLYAVDPANFNLLRIDATGQVDILANLNLSPTNFYLAGDVSPDGKYLTIIGSDNGSDQELINIDLESPTFNTQTINLGGGTFFSDIAYDPSNGDLYGFDQTNHSLAKIENTTITLFNPIAEDKDIFGLYFDAFGTLLGYGNAVFGVTNALYAVNTSNGNINQITSGAPFFTADVASCPYAIQINNEVIPQSSFPCSDITYSYKVANGSNQTIFNAQIEHQLPTGFTFLQLLQNDLAGNVDASTPPNVFRLNDVTIPPGVFDLEISVEIGDIPAGDYNSQALVNDLPNNFGENLISNDPNTIKESDSTGIEIIRIDEDSIDFSNLVCIGEDLVIDASVYGNNVVWNNGSMELEQTITDTGIYSFESSSGCQSVVVTYDVTFASCPFTVELGLRIEPNVTLPCSELEFTYIVGNDSGGTRTNVSLEDDLPEGFTVLTILSNPFGGQWDSSEPNKVMIEGMNVPLGIDSIKFLIEVGDVAPQILKNVGILGNLPPEIGAFRISDDPSTQPIDSSKIEILGVETDSFFIEKFICPEETIVLDATDFGIGHQWSNGSTNPTLEVNEIGQYDLIVFDGCEPTYVFYTVKNAPELAINFEEDKINLVQGDSVLLVPIITNSGNELNIIWQDNQNGIIDCDSCLNLWVKPFFSTDYQVNIANESCKDSTFLHINIDIIRRIYAPNAFSPNNDGINDVFFIQSPDFGILKELTIYDRWGGEVFKSDNVQLNSPQNSWGTQFLNLRSDVYLWRAEIEFIDGTTDYFYGDVILLN